METQISDSLSSIRTQTSALFDWDKLDALTVGFVERGAGLLVPGHHVTKHETEANAEQEEKRQELARLFTMFQNQCHAALSQLRRSAHICFAVIVLAVIIAIAGSVTLALLHSQRVLGGLLSAGGLGTLVAVLTRAIGINRAVAMLEVLPTRYQLAFNLATTAKQYDTVFRTFMDETSSLRGR
jgi:hypothetical protein